MRASTDATGAAVSNYEPYRNNTSDELSVSINKLTGKKVSDLEGYIGNPYGEGAIFHIHRVVFDDGTFMWLEGGHDVVYAYPPRGPNGAQFLVPLEELYDPED